jgi:hypothetical protein
LISRHRNAVEDENQGRLWIRRYIITYLTSLDERMLMFNFNSTIEEHDGYKEALERSKDSIKIAVKK